MRRRLASLALPAALGLAALGPVAPAGAAAPRLFSYDPANTETRHAAGAVTLEFRQRLIFTTVLRVLATEGQAGADLAPASEAALGRGGLTAVIGAKAPERDLYAVLPTGEGPAMVSAFCPGSTRGWMAIGRIKTDRDLRIYVLGDSPKGGPARLCQTLDFTWHGEWRVPRAGGFDTRLLEQSRHPR